MEPEPPKRKTALYARQMALATELPFVLVGATVVGGLVGYWLDLKLGSRPWLLLLLGGIGFYAGLREVMRRLDKLE